MRIRATLSAAAFLGLFAATAQAQGTQNPVEVGIDAQISFGLDDQGTSISIPAQKIRAGFMISPVMTIEPSLGFYRISNDGSSMSSTALDVSLLYHFSPARTARQFYVRPVIGPRNPEQLRYSYAAGDLSLDEATIRAIAEATVMQGFLHNRAA